MDISQLTLKLIILLIPGGIGSIILERLTDHKEWSPFKFIINSILIGFLSYSFLQLCCLPSGINLSIWDNISDKAIIPYNEVLWSTPFGVLFGFLFTCAHTYKWLNKLAHKWRLSYKFGDENLFSYFLNAEETNYVYVRSINLNLTYLGKVEAISETNDFKEMLLSNVSVFSYKDSELLYEIDKIYLSLPKDEVIIEAAIIKNNGIQ